MKERRSGTTKWKSLLKNAAIEARLTVPSGWTVTLKRETFRFAFKATGLDNLYFDPYLVRERFLDLKTAPEALDFFRLFGPFDVHPSTHGIEVPPGSAGPAPSLSFPDLLEVQRFYREVLTQPRYWAKKLHSIGTDSLSEMSDFRAYVRLNLLRSPNITISLDKTPSLLIESPYVSKAIYATIYLDWLSGLKSVNCPECHKTVQQKNKHFLRFCSERCSALSRKKKYLRVKETSNGKA